MSISDGPEPVDTAAGVAIPTAARAAGATVSPWAAVGADQKSIKIAADRTALKPGDVINVTTEISFDAGRTWQLLVGFTTTGDALVDPLTKLPLAQSSVAVNLPQQDSQIVRTTLDHQMPVTTGITIATSAAAPIVAAA